MRTQVWAVLACCGFGIWMAAQSAAAAESAGAEARSAAELTTPEAQLYIQNKSFDDSEEAREEILKAFDGLRAADVSDGMDQVGRPDVGVMDREIVPLWRDTEKFSHVVCGFAFTVRYLPTDKVPPNPHPNNDYMPFQQMWYSTLAGAQWGRLLRPGDVIVADASGISAGFLGSSNGMDWMRNGARGVITNGGPRDTDEIIAMKLPVYCPVVNYGTAMGRMETESALRPINCGGVIVYPGDVVVADGDGVVVVPRELALEVARIAREIYDGDIEGRAKKIEAMGLKHDARTKGRD